MSLDELDPQEFLNAAPMLTPELVRDTLDVSKGLSARRAPGAPSPENVAQRLAHWKRILQ